MARARCSATAAGIVSPAARVMAVAIEPTLANLQLLHEARGLNFDFYRPHPDRSVQFNIVDDEGRRILPAEWPGIQVKKDGSA